MRGWHAQNNLGAMYAMGQGVPMGYADASFWPDLAATSWNGAGQGQAAKARDKVAARLTPSELALAQERASKWLADHQK